MSMQTAQDFCDESDALHEVIAAQGDSAFQTVTDFKQWTVDDVLQHLHYFNVMADLSLTDPARFAADYADLSVLRDNGTSLVAATDQMLGGLKGQPLLQAWRDYYREMTPRWVATDPKQRVKWVGPDMSARSSITARLMETWSHGQEVYDVFGLVREDTDRIKNIVVIGINTFGWTHKNRGEAIPATMPAVVLTAPSGERWSWGEPDAKERIEGSAQEFCMVVTQTRNIADTSLTVTGETARHWMTHAQCFAGPPQEPPAPGTRRRRSNGATT